MAFDEALAERVRGAVAGVDGVIEKRMFGGLAFVVDGPGVRVFDMTGRPMKGWVLVGPGAVADEEGLGLWVTRGLDFAESLPPK